MIKIAALTDIGNVRKKNQDGFFVDGLSKNAKPLASIYYESNDDDFFAFVADGVGSTNDAEFAVSELLLAASMKKDLICFLTRDAQCQEARVEFPDPWVV